MLNGGNGSFTEIGSGVGLDGVADARGIAFADLDRDGDADLLVNNYKAKTAYYVNGLADGASWLAVRVEGRRANRDGVGAQIIATVGERRLVRLVGNHGYSGQSSLEQIFGLADSTEVDRLEVRWPDGTIEDFGGPHPAGQRLRLVEGMGVPSAPASVVRKPRERPSFWYAAAVAGFGLLLMGSLVGARWRRAP